MWRVRKNILTVAIATMLVFTGCSGENMASMFAPTTSVEAKEANGVTEQSTFVSCSIGTAEKYVANQLKLTVSDTGYDAYRDALVAAQILLPTELMDTAKSINKGELALLASRIMMYKGEKVDADLSEIIVSKKRISDLSKIDEPYKSCVVQVFSEGVIVGNSNGAYSQSRKFNVSEIVTAGAMKSAILKALGEKDRSVMSPDGQLTRKTNLPKNYKKYEYILASFPKKFYEQRFSYQYGIYYSKPEKFSDYVAPAEIDDLRKKYNDTEVLTQEHIEWWMNVIKENLQYRLNFNYKTDGKEWVKGLRNTYYIYNNSYDSNKTELIEYYTRQAKKNKVIVESSDIVIEPSTLYMDGASYVFRCYVRFRITSADELFTYNSGNQRNLIFSTYSTNLKNLNIGKWNERCFDIGVSTCAYGDSGSGFSVAMDDFLDRNKPDLSKYQGKNIWTLY